VFEPYRFRNKDFVGGDAVFDFAYAVTSLGRPAESILVDVRG